MSSLSPGPEDVEPCPSAPLPRRASAVVRSVRFSARSPSPGTEIAWAADCREAINRSVKRAH
ncbi:LasR-specific antiactivator QslA [Pseudomonas sp. PA1(2017)]|uniref:LasR-specific antiactivator QslA n=1 Tax=Pseudomonas sp. PA1(2017) TaxID=1932113 RepID=UPI0035321C32